MTYVVKRSQSLRAKDVSREEVKEWQDRASNAYEKALALKARGAKMPCPNPPKETPLVKKIIMAHIPLHYKLTGGLLVSAFLSDAANNLKVSQSSLMAAQENSSASTDKFLESTAKFHDIQNQLRKLDAQKVTFVRNSRPLPCPQAKTWNSEKFEAFYKILFEHCLILKNKYRPCSNFFKVFRPWLNLSWITRASAS